MPPAARTQGAPPSNPGTSLASPPSSSGAPTQKTPTPARGPILDPWADEQTTPGTFNTEVTPGRRDHPTRREIQSTDSNVLVIEMRARPQGPSREDSDDGDGDVITSAATLEEVLKRRPPQARPAPPPLPSPTSRPSPNASGSAAGAIGPGAPEPATPSPRAAAPISIPKSTAPVAAPSSDGGEGAGSTTAEHPTTTSAPAAPAAQSTPSAKEPAPPAGTMVVRPSFANIKLADISAFGDLPSDVHDLLTEVARIEDLSKDEEVSGFGAALVIQGDAVVCATITDTPAHRAPRGSLVPARGSLAEGTALRVVASASDTRVAIWNQAVLDMALKSCPWVLEDLHTLADRLQAFAGVTLGPLGEVDEETRGKVLEKMTVRVVPPLEMIAEQGQKLPFLAIVGAGTVELLKGDRVTGDVGPGDFVFPGVVVRDMPAPTSVRAGSDGAILVVGDQSLASEILTGSPPIIGILG